MWDTITGWFEKAGDWYDKNSGWIEKGAGLLRDGYNAAAQNNAEQGSRSAILDALKMQLASRQQRQQDLYNYQLQQMQAGQAASAANAAASMANQRAALAAQKKATKTQQKFLKQIAKTYEPYTEAAKTLVPKQAENYGQFLGTTSLLNAYLTPRAMDVLGNAPKSVTEFAPKQSAVAVQAPQGQATQFLSLEELLKRGG